MFLSWSHDTNSGAMLILSSNAFYQPPIATLSDMSLDRSSNMICIKYFNNNCSMGAECNRYASEDTNQSSRGWVALLCLSQEISVINYMD